MRALIALLLGAVALGPAQGQALTPVEQAGQRIYHDGLDRSGRPIAGRVAGSATPLKGKAIACGNCHGEDGRGRRESGVDPGDVTWPDLTKPYGHVHVNERRHGPYDAHTLRRAIRGGVDPAGNALEPAMPRYELDDADADALVAYLKRLDVQRDPGITDTTIRIGTVLPTSGRLAATGEAVQRVLQGYFDRINEHGGLHGRDVQLLVAGMDDTDSARTAAERLLQRAPVLALVAPLTARNEDGFTAAAEAAQLPVVGPLTLFPESASASSAVVFHLLPGVAELAEALAAQMHPALGLGGRPVVLLHGTGEVDRSAAEALEARLRARGYSTLFLEPAGDAASVAARLKQRNAAAVLVLSPGAGLSGVVRATALASVDPYWLVPAPFVSADMLDLPRELDGRIVLAYPTLPTDRTQAGLAAIEHASGGGFARGHQQAVQVAALGSAMVLVEGLSRAGRDLSRRKLLAALESLQGFETGLMPRLSYSADRRIGSYGAYVVKLDLANRAFRPLPEFVRLQ